MSDGLRWALLNDGKRSQGSLPPARTYFSMLSYEGKLWMFGGYGDAKEGRFNDLRVYNPENDRWAKVANRGTFPKPIYLHSSVIYQNKMWVFGGSTGKDTNGFYTFDFKDNTWNLLSSNTGAPSPRYGHAACVCGDKMYLTGGCHRQIYYLKDTYEYTFSTKTWRKLGDAPIDLAYHTLIPFRGQVYLFGGFNGQAFGDGLYRLESDEWKAVPCTGTVPSSRCGCAANIIGSTLYIYGGYTATGHKNDLHTLDLNTWTWKKMRSDNRPASRAYLQSAVLDGTLYIFGGYDGSKCLIDFRSLRLTAPLNIGERLFRSSVSDLVDYTLEAFQCTELSSLDSKSLATLFANLKLTVPKNTNSPSYEFDISQLETAIGFGFDHDSVIEEMTTMHKAGQDTKNLNLLLDRLFKRANDAPAQDPAELKRQVSERTELRKKLNILQEKNEDLRSCKICFDAVMDCVITPCNHLCCCSDCGSTISECPICRKTITGRTEIYWQ